MDKNEFIAEAKKRGYSDSSIQELLDIHERLVQLGHPLEYGFEGALSEDEIDEFIVSEETLKTVPRIAP
jgi:hypothetical protein